MWLVNIYGVTHASTVIKSLVQLLISSWSTRLHTWNPLREISSEDDQQLLVVWKFYSGVFNVFELYSFLIYEEERSRYNSVYRISAIATLNCSYCISLQFEWWDEEFKFFLNVLNYNFIEKKCFVHALHF